MWGLKLSKFDFRMKGTFSNLMQNSSFPSSFSLIGSGSWDADDVDDETSFSPLLNFLSKLDGCCCCWEVVENFLKASLKTSFPIGSSSTEELLFPFSLVFVSFMVFSLVWRTRTKLSKFADAIPFLSWPPSWTTSLYRSISKKTLVSYK